MAIRTVRFWILTFVLLMVTAFAAFGLIGRVSAQTVPTPQRLCEILGPYTVELDAANVFMEDGDYFIEITGIEPPTAPFRAFLDGNFVGWIIYLAEFETCTWFEPEVVEPPALETQDIIIRDNRVWLFINTDCELVFGWSDEEVRSADLLITNSVTLASYLSHPEDTDGTTAYEMPVPLGFEEMISITLITHYKDGLSARQEFYTYPCEARG